MSFIHPPDFIERWQKLSLIEQVANIGSEVYRVWQWQGKDQKLFEAAVARTLELFNFTISDPRWKRRLKELTRAREVFCDAVLGGKEYNSSLEDLDKYFFQFALAARLGK